MLARAAIAALARPLPGAARVVALALALALAALGLPARAPAAAPRKAPARLVITGLVFDGILKGDPEPEEAVRIANSGRGVDADAAGFSFSDELAAPRLVVVEATDKRNAGRRVRLPLGTVLGPGEEVWVAHRGDAFLQIFGYPPDFEVVDTLPGVREAAAPDGWPSFPATRGVVTLHAPDGEVVDLVAYDRKGTGLGVDLPPGLWKGPPVILDGTDPYGWSGRVLARDKRSDGWPQDDSDSATDWDSGASRARLGVDEVHRIELPGQTHFVATPRRVKARVTAASSPENSYATMVKALREAKSEILLHVYEFKHEFLCDELVAAKERGVDVRVYLEGSPVGGIPDGERHVVSRLSAAKIPVLFLGAPDGAKRIRVRYRFDHAKYVVIDRKTAVIGSENYGYSGMPVDPSYGNRGWVVRIDEPGFATQLRRIFSDDTSRPYPDLEGTSTAAKAYPDLVAPEDVADDKYGPPYKDPAFKPDLALRTGKYSLRKAPATVTAEMGLELVLCPDTCLDENFAVLGLIGSATRELLVIQNSIPLHWGKKKETPETAPTLPLAGVVASARRGVRTRVLLDSTWYNVEAKDDRDNDDTCRYLNRIAAKEELDLSCKVIDLEAAHLEKIHTKGVIADGRRVLISSINWTENSFKGNREVGVVIDHPEVAGYYRDLFLHDWTATRLYRVAAGKKGARALNATGKLARRFAPGELIDVVAEIGDELEVRLGDGKVAALKSDDTARSLLASPGEALALIGRAVEVEGVVRAVHPTKGGVYLNFGDNWKRDFSAFVEEAVLDSLKLGAGEPGERLKGRTVRVSGTLFEKNGPALTIKDRTALVLKP